MVTWFPYDADVMWPHRSIREASVVVPVVLCIIVGQGCRSFGVSPDSWLLLELEKWSQNPHLRVMGPLIVSLVLWVPFKYFSFGWRISLCLVVFSDYTDKFLFSISKWLISLLLMLTSCLCWMRLHLLTDNMLLACFGSPFPWVRKSYARFILFCETRGRWHLIYLNKSLGLACPLF